MNSFDLNRLEDKVDILTDDVRKLVLFEERQAVQALAIVSLTTRLTSTEQRLDMWINRGVGVWAVVAVAMTLVKIFHP